MCKYKISDVCVYTLRLAYWSGLGFCPKQTVRHWFFLLTNVLTALSIKTELLSLFILYLSINFQSVNKQAKQLVFSSFNVSYNT